MSLDSIPLTMAWEDSKNENSHYCLGPGDSATVFYRARSLVGTTGPKGSESSNR